MNTTDTIQVTDKLMAGLQGFVTLVKDPHQIKAFYDLHEALQQTQPMRSFGGKNSALFPLQFELRLTHNQAH
jgi:hypothetical protein